MIFYGNKSQFRSCLILILLFGLLLTWQNQNPRRCLVANAALTSVLAASPTGRVVTASSLFRDEGEVFAPSATILSTSPCHLETHHPELKQFLTDPDGAMSYENVQVVFAEGHRPRLSIYYEDDVDSEEHFQLWHLRTQEEFHALMQSKGFVQKRGDETAANKRKKSIRGGTFHHAAAKQAFLDAKDSGKDTFESSKAAMDAFLQSLNPRQARADLTDAIHRNLRDERQLQSFLEQVKGAPKYKHGIQA